MTHPAEDYQNPREDGDQRTGGRTIDKVLEEYGRCGGDGTYCGDHILNSYRIKLLEEAKDALCIATKNNAEAQIKNSTFIRWSAAVLSIAAVVVTLTTGAGWANLVKFTEKVYQLREADHKVFEEYRVEAQKVRSNHAAILKGVVDEMGRQAEVNEQQNEDLDLLRQALRDQQVESDKQVGK